MTEKRVRWRGLAPDVRVDHKTSVYRTKGLSETEIWELGRVRIELVSQRTVYARGELTVERIENHRLLIEPDNTPPRHANIAGWPLPKDEWKARAIDLAKEAQLVLR